MSEARTLCLLVATLVLVPSADLEAKSRFARRGTFAAGGGLAFSRSKVDVEKTGDITFTEISFSPGFHYFVIDGLAVGLSPRYTRESRRQDGSELSRSRIAGFASAVYYHRLTGTLFVNGGLALGYYGGGEEDNLTNSSASGFGFDASGGVTLAFGTRFGGFVSALLHFAYALGDTTTEIKGLAGDQTVDSDMWDVGLSTYLGVYF